MRRHRWMPAAAALLALGCLAGGWVLLADRGSDGGASPQTSIVSSSPGGSPGPAASSFGAHAGSPMGHRHPMPRAAEPPPSRTSAAGGSAPRGLATAPSHWLTRRIQPLVSVRRGARIVLRAKPGGKVVKQLGWRTRFGSPTVLAVFARRGLWAGVPTPLLADGRLGWVRLDPSRMRFGWTRFSIVVDLSSKAAALRLGKRTLRSFSVTVGAPASPTPTGRFAITDTFRGGLDPAYGCCALATSATQSNLPSGWLGGDRIAIHGTTGPLGAALSHGCIRTSNAAVSALVRRVGLGTPVVIRQ